MEVTIQIPKFFIEVIKNSKVWKENVLTGDKEIEERCIKNAFKLYIDTMMGVGSWFEEEVSQFINNNEDGLVDEFYEATLIK